MPSLLSTLGIDRLSVAERLQLVGEIWDSIAPALEQLPLTEAQRQELDRRLAALEANPGNVVPWEEVEARALLRDRERRIP
jgi:putative addiction module component (TIGR02574 family)